jgi:hypothetical protein
MDMGIQRPSRHARKVGAIMKCLENCDLEITSTEMYGDQLVNVCAAGHRTGTVAVAKAKRSPRLKSTMEVIKPKRRAAPKRDQVYSLPRIEGELAANDDEKPW